METSVKMYSLSQKLSLKMEENHKIAIHNYKTGEKIVSGDQLPVPFDKRTSTDVFCTVITSLFAITMLGIAIAKLNLPALQKMTYPTDSQGRHCTLDNSNFNYLYFPSPKNPTRRLCLAQCPKGSESKLDCWPTEDISCSANPSPQFQVVIYSSEPSQTSLGLYCLPTDLHLKNQILQGAHLEEMYNFVSAYKAVGVSLLCGIGLGLMGILLFSCCPGVTAYLGIILGGLCCLALAAILLITNSDLLAVYKVIVILFSVILILVGVMLLWGACFRQTQISLSVNYIKQASECLWEAPHLILVSFIFVALLAGLITLCTFQVMAYWSASDMVLETGSVYEHPHSTFATVMTTLCVIEFLWGLCFLKEAFNFLFSGVAVTWHFLGELSFSVAISKLFKFHWGSVVGGAFLLNVLYPFDLIYDLVKPDPTVQGGLCSALCCCCERLLDLCRTQTMVMINLVGAPYCNSSRLCQQIVFHSNYTIGSESANRFVRLGGHVLLASIATLIGWIFMLTNGSGKSSVLGILLCFIMNLFVSTFFICLLKDMAEALLFCDLMDNYLQNREQIDPSQMMALGLQNRVSKQLFGGEGYEVIRTEERQR